MSLISNSLTSINTIKPHINTWAWDLYLTGTKNHWVPSDISMKRDIEQWKSKQLSEAERLIIKRCLGFFAGGESIVSNNILLVFYKYITDGNCRNYMARQVMEETIHNHTVAYICDSLNLEINDIYEAYQTIPCIKEKDDFLMNATKSIYSPSFDINTVEGKQTFIKTLVTYYLVCEGLLFYSGFAMLLSFGRLNKIPGISEQIQYTLRDETLHCKFGTSLINALQIEFGKTVFTTNFMDELSNLFLTAIDLEQKFAYTVIPEPILGLSAEMVIEYINYLGNIRMSSIGLPIILKSVKNPFPWLSEMVELGKNKNFFETRVTEYSTGSLKEDW